MLPDSNYVMIIDDDIQLCHLLSTMLYTKNVNVVCAYTISEAEKIMQQRPPFLVFLDNSLPDGNGIEFLDKLRTEYPEIKEVMITGDASEELKQRALEHGCLAFLEKPFSYRVVSELIEKTMTVQS